MSKKLNDVIWIKDGSGLIHNGSSNIETVKGLLNETGKGFCLAKFTQVTMHLGSGAVHSCHHPAPHLVQIEELVDNPGALFNSTHLKAVRAEMFNNVKTAECEYCWRVEGNNGPSDRYYKSIEGWALAKHDEIKEKGPLEDYYPTYLEVDFSNACNFACIYCGPEFSSKWVESLKQHGPIKLMDGTKHQQWAQGWQDLDSLTYKNREFNPYVNAFWKWFPEAFKHLTVYRITGGEPLMSKETFRSMDWLIDNPNPELEFNINTNMGVPDKLWDQFVDKVTLLIGKKSVKRFTVFTSADGWGERAEYSRVGMDFNVFKRRYEQLLEIGNIRVVTMCAFNILSITSIKELLEWQVGLKKKYNPSNAAVQWEIDSGYNLHGEGESYTDRKKKNPDHFATVGIDMPYLRHPEFLDAQHASPELVQQYLVPAINYMAANTCSMEWDAHQGFEPYELEKFKRVVMNTLYYRNSQENREKSDIQRAKFFEFVNQIDDRTGQNFLETYPEMREFYNSCSEAHKTIRGSENIAQ